MINIARNNTVWCCKSPLEQDAEHQILFPNPSAQINYFTSKAVRVFNDVTFVRNPVAGEVQSYITLEMPITQAYNFNYIMFKNGAESNKYFFAFVTRVEYKSETATRLHLKSDPFQNWQFDLKYNTCFIERQTPVNYATKNNLADTVSTGQLVEKITSNENFRGAYFVFCSTDITQDDPSESIPYALKIGDYTIPCWTLYFTPLENERMGKVLVQIANKGYGDRILSAVYVPFLNDVNAIKTHNMSEYGGFNLATECPISNLKKEVTLDISSFDGYGKELTYPYAVVVMEDMTTGQSVELAPEKFENGQIKFEIQGSISETPSYKVIPKGYCGQYLAFNESLVVKCSTSLPIVNNLYAKYMMENKDANNMARINAFSSIVAGAATASPMSLGLGAVSTFQTIAGINMQESQARKLGNSVTAITDGAMDRLVFNNGVKFYLKTMDSNHRKRARDFWTMYGYPVDGLQVPNLRANDRYTYIKMADVNIDGDNVPQDELQEIKEMYKKGVTLWANGDIIGIY